MIVAVRSRLGELLTEDEVLILEALLYRASRGLTWGEVRMLVNCGADARAIIRKLREPAEPDEYSTDPIQQAVCGFDSKIPADQHDDLRALCRDLKLDINVDRLLGQAKEEP